MADQDALPVFIVDAFTSAPFSGNPAAVCLVTTSHVSNCISVVFIDIGLVISLMRTVLNSLGVHVTIWHKWYMYSKWVNNNYGRRDIECYAWLVIIICRRFLPFFRTPWVVAARNSSEFNTCSIMSQIWHWQELSYCSDGSAILQKSNVRCWVRVPLFNEHFCSNLWEYHHKSGSADCGEPDSVMRIRLRWSNRN